MFDCRSLATFGLVLIPRVVFLLSISQSDFDFSFVNADLALIYTAERLVGEMSCCYTKCIIIPPFPSNET